MNPKQKLEQAAQAFLAAVATPIDASLTVYKGVENSIAIDDEESNTQPQARELPCVSLIAEGAHSEAVFGTRLFQGVLAVVVAADAENTTDTAFDALCTDVFDKFNIAELAANMSASTENFTCVFARIVENGYAVREGNIWENVIRIECVYGQADL